MRIELWHLALAGVAIYFYIQSKKPVTGGGTVTTIPQYPSTTTPPATTVPQGKDTTATDIFAAILGGVTAVTGAVIGYQGDRAKAEEQAAAEERALLAAELGVIP